MGRVEKGFQNLKANYRRVARATSLAIAMAFLMAAFNNCSGGFESTTEMANQSPGMPSPSPAPQPPTPAPANCASVSQWGITWTFDQAYPCGQFINGDYWVTPLTSGGKVRITAMSPAFSNGHNGWEVNPTDIVKQGFDSGAADYTATVVPSLPYDASAGSSIIKSISASSCGKTCVKTAAVLTVLATAPENNGATAFRPPYFGTNKMIYSSTGVNFNSLPSFAPTSAINAQMISLQTALNTVQRVQLAYKPDWVGDQIHPLDNFQLTDPYGPDVSNQNVNAVLRAMLDVPGDSAQDRKSILVALIQYGIDNYGVLINGGMWVTNGGHDLGMRLPIVLAAFFLNEPNMKAAIAAAPRNAFAETGTTYLSPYGVPLWGQPLYNGAQSYWDDVTQQATRTYRDPYGFIDGGPSPGTWYQACCTSQGMKGSTLVVRLVPGLQAIWADNVSLDYADRWVTHGALAAADPCAPLSAGGGPDPNHAGQCKLDPNLTPGSTYTNFSCQAGKKCGRFPNSDGTMADGGDHRSFFVDAFWASYR